MTPTPSAADVERVALVIADAIGEGLHYNSIGVRRAAIAAIAALTPTTDTAGLLRAAERALVALRRFNWTSSPTIISAIADLERALVTTPPARSDGPSNQEGGGPHNTGRTPRHSEDRRADEASETAEDIARAALERSSAASNIVKDIASAICRVEGLDPDEIQEEYENGDYRPTDAMWTRYADAIHGALPAWVVEAPNTEQAIREDLLDAFAYAVWMGGNNDTEHDMRHWNAEFGTWLFEIAADRVQAMHERGVDVMAGFEATGLPEAIRARSTVTAESSPLGCASSERLGDRERGDRDEAGAVVVGCPYCGAYPGRPHTSDCSVPNASPDQPQAAPDAREAAARAIFQVLAFVAPNSVHPSFEHDAEVWFEATDAAAAALAKPQPWDERVDKVVEAKLTYAVDRATAAEAKLAETEQLKNTWINKAYDAIDRADRNAAQLAEAHKTIAEQRAERDTLRYAVARARQFVRNGVAFGFIRMPDPGTSDMAHELPGLLDAALEATAKGEGA